MSDIVERLRAPLPNGMCGDSMGCNAASICLCSHIEDQRELFTEAADEIEVLRAEVERMREALEFYADKEAWNQPPVKTVSHELLGPAYENAASRVRLDRGKIARAALTQTKDTTDDA